MQKNEKSFLKRFFGSRWFLVTAFVVAVLVAFGYARAYYQDYKIRQEIDSLQEQVKKLEHKKIESMDILKYVTSDAFVEEKARTELNLKKPGENVLIIKNQAGQVNADETTQKSPVEKTLLHNTIKWWYYFLNRKPINN
ncbi:MAG: septum formation initiator family protein [Patescibacteria group bacterium]